MTCRARQGFSAVGGVAAQQTEIDVNCANNKQPMIGSAGRSLRMLSLPEND
jgi:hypothetical protein